MKMENQKIKIPLHVKKEIIGYLTIISLYPSKFIGINFNNNLGSFSNIIKTEIPDDITPIQFCNLGNKHYIMLLEETSYQISFNPLNNYDDIKIIPTILEKTSSVYESFNLPLNNQLSGSINFKSFAGKSFFDVEIDGERSNLVPFEVRSKKINYQQHYTNMIGDLAQAVSGILFQQNTPLFERFYFDDKLRNTHYEDYMFLEYLFLDENLPYAYEHIRKNVYVNLEEHNETIPTSFASNLGHSGLINIICSPEYLHKTEDPPINWPNNMKKFVPESINQSYYEDSVDTQENRLLKYFLESIDTLIESLLNNLDKEHNIKERLHLFDEKINEYLSDKWLEHVGKLEIVPMNSQILQKKEGYRNIFKYYLNYEFGFRPQWEEIEDLIKGYERKLSELYEFWCYFKLLKIMEKLSGKKLNYENVFEINTNQWTLNLNVGLKSRQTFNLNVEDEEITLDLFYNKSFMENSTYKSYSLNLIPDYTFKVNFKNKYYFLHFDAKYKSKGIPNDAEYNKKDHVYKFEDVYKMHTYKDAIVNTKGAYVLYPGNKTKIYRMEEGIIPSVGAFPLTPDNTHEQGEKLSRTISKFIEALYLEYKINNDEIIEENLYPKTD
jgi:predicted component of viral defense system (DUF524 family)